MADKQMMLMLLYNKNKNLSLHRLKVILLNLAQGAFQRYEFSITFFDKFQFRKWCFSGEKHDQQSNLNETSVSGFYLWVRYNILRSN